MREIEQDRTRWRRQVYVWLYANQLLFDDSGDRVVKSGVEIEG
jgi:hypothetical protein